MQFRAGILGGLFLLALAASVAYSYLLKNPLLWANHALAGPLRLPYYALLYQKGEVIHLRPDTYLTPPDSIADYLVLSATRFVYFFSFVVPQGFSMVHHLIVAMFYIPTYALALLGIYGLVKRKAGLDARGEKIMIITLAVILTFAFFHAHTEVDSDWRYRLPIAPYLILTQAVGVATLCNCIPKIGLFTKKARRPDC